MNNFYSQYPQQFPQYGNNMQQSPPVNTNNIKEYIAMTLSVSLDVAEFVKMSEPFANNGSEARHACPVSLLAIESYKLMQLDYYGKATIDVGYCPNCCKIIYYVEKYA